MTRIIQRRMIAPLAIIVPLLALFAFVAVRSGPLAPVRVTETRVEARQISPSLFGVGTVEARATYKIGPTFAGRIARLDVDVGDAVKAGQTLGEMEPVDLDDRVRSQGAALRGAEAALQEAQSRQAYAKSEARRYEELYAARSTSEEILAAKQQELKIADAALVAAREDLSRARSDHEGFLAQRSNLRLVAPVDGVVILRGADPGTTVVAGEAVIEMIDPGKLWINTRFDQISAGGLSPDLHARIVLRSRDSEPLAGRVVRVEPVADPITEEALAKVVFDATPAPLPPIGELAEVTIGLPQRPAAPVIPNAAVSRIGDKMGVWRIVNGGLRFAPVKLGAADLDGNVEVREGLEIGDRIVVYSERTLGARSRVRVVDNIREAAR